MTNFINNKEQGKKTLRDLLDVIQMNGFAETIQEIIDPDCIKNEEMAKLWAEAKSVLDKMDEMFEYGDLDS